MVNTPVVLFSATGFAALGLFFVWSSFGSYLYYPVMFCVLFSMATYLGPVLAGYVYQLGPQNLKSKYPGAEWALVTGASSGIGLAIATQLAQDGFNIIIAAIPNSLLDEAIAKLKKDFQGQQFIPVGCDLSDATGGYMDDLRKVTDNKDVQVIFSNAGYIKTGFFADTNVKAQLCNYHCNATASVHIAHHYIDRMREKDLTGCVVFTSSPAAFIPAPFSAMYGATKAFLTEFAASIAPEVKADGIDVAVIHPSPINSHFYKKAHKIDEIKFFKSTAVSPMKLAKKALSGVGRQVVIDQGYYPTSLKFMLKILDLTFMSELMAVYAHNLPTFKQMKDGLAKNK